MAIFFSFIFSFNSDGNQMLLQFRAPSDFPPLLPPYLNEDGRSWFVTAEAPPLEVPVVPAPGKGTALGKGSGYLYRESAA